ncbi:MAG: DMT family transporter [Fervidicoccaceae archaeon]
MAWLSISSSSVLVLASGATALQAAFWRTALSSLALLALAPVLGGRPPLSPRAVLAGALLGLHFLTWMRSLFLIPVALSTSIVVWYPAISALIDRALLSERLERRQLAGLGIAGLGTLLLLAPLLSLGSSREQLEGAALAALGAALAAGYFSLGRAARVGGESLWSYATTAYLSASATLLLYSAASGESLTPPESSWPFLLALAAVPMFGGHTVMNYLLKHARTVSVTSIALGEPAGASLLALIALGQAPPRTAALGVPLTALGLALVVGAERKSSSRPSANIEGAGVPEPGQRGRT